MGSSNLALSYLAGFYSYFQGARYFAKQFVTKREGEEYHEGYEDARQICADRQLSANADGPYTDIFKTTAYEMGLQEARRGKPVTDAPWPQQDSEYFYVMAAWIHGWYDGKFSLPIGKLDPYFWHGYYGFFADLDKRIDSRELDEGQRALWKQGVELARNEHPDDRLASKEDPEFTARALNCPAKHNQQYCSLLVVLGRQCNQDNCPLYHWRENG